MTLEEPILIFIPRISSSKEPSLLRSLCLALIQLKGKTKESREWGVAQCGVCLERGVPLYLYKSEGGASINVWRETLGYTASAWRHATATTRRGRAASRGERPPPRSGRPLTTTSGHRLCMAGIGLVMGRYPMGFCPFWVGMVGVSLFSLRESALKSAFWWIIPCIHVCDLQNIVLQIHVELG